MKRLSVEFGSSAEFQCVLSCNDFPIGDLLEVTISLYHAPVQNASVYLVGLRKFLYAAKNTIILELRGLFAITLVLKLLEPRSLFQDRSVTLRIRNDEIELKPGFGRGIAINSLRYRMTDVYSGSWEEIYAKIDAYWFQNPPLS